MQIINEVWCVPDGDELIRKKIMENKKKDSNPKDIDLYYERKVREAALSRVTNVGIWSRPMSNLFEKVEAFEPTDKNRECLIKNLKDVNNVEIFHHGLGASNRVGNLLQGVRNCGDCKIIYADRIKGVVFGPGDVVNVRTLDSHNFNNIGLIKIDTQGHELPILRGAIETIKKHRPVIVFEIDQNKDECCELLESLGASRVWVQNKCNMVYSFDYLHNQFSN